MLDFELITTIRFLGLFTYFSISYFFKYPDASFCYRDNKKKIKINISKSILSCIISNRKVIELDLNEFVKVSVRR